VTFKEALPDFRREVIDQRYKSNPGEVAAYLTRDCTALHSRRLDRIRASDIADVVTKKAGTPNAAAKLLVLLESYFAWSVLVGRIGADPAAGLTAKRLAAYEPRERVLTPDELRGPLDARRRALRSPAAVHAADGVPHRRGDRLPAGAARRRRLDDPQDEERPRALVAAVGDRDRAGRRGLAATHL
jgi:hypothetical protein